MSQSFTQEQSIDVAFQDIAKLYTNRIQSLEHYSIIEANYFYFDFKHQSIVMTGTVA